MEREAARELAELGAVFVILGGFLHEQGFVRDAILDAIAGGLLFALILSVGALLGMLERKT